jgi:hypothetical protein
VRRRRGLLHHSRALLSFLQLWPVLWRGWLAPAQGACICGWGGSAECKQGKASRAKPRTGRRCSTAGCKRCWQPPILCCHVFFFSWYFTDSANQLHALAHGRYAVAGKTDNLDENGLARRAPPFERVLEDYVGAGWLVGGWLVGWMAGWWVQPTLELCSCAAAALVGVLCDSFLRLPCKPARKRAVERCLAQLCKQPANRNQKTSDHGATEPPRCWLPCPAAVDQWRKLLQSAEEAARRVSEEQGGQLPPPAMLPTDLGHVYKDLPPWRHLLMRCDDSDDDSSGSRQGADSAGAGASAERGEASTSAAITAGAGARAAEECARASPAPAELARYSSQSGSEVRSEGESEGQLETRGSGSSSAAKASSKGSMDRSLSLYLEEAGLDRPGRHMMYAGGGLCLCITFGNGWLRGLLPGCLELAVVAGLGGSRPLHDCGA